MNYNSYGCYGILDISKKYEHQKYLVILFVNFIHLTDFKYKLNKETHIL